MRINDLFGKHRGEDIYILGTGPSVRTTKLDFLNHKVVIGLNQAGRLAPCNYLLTAHPEILGDNESQARQVALDRSRPAPRWIVKRKAPLQHLAFDHPDYYVYTTQENWGIYLQPPPDQLFLGRGIHLTAMQLAYLMGAKQIWLVGCDMAVLDSEHHGHHQHVRYHGLLPTEVMREYYVWAVKARELLLRVGIPVYTISPFLGLIYAEDDYKQLKQFYRLEQLPAPTDTSSYLRKQADI